MSQFPALPLWTDAYLADTRHLSAQEHGAYLLLIMMAWRMPDCSLPDDDAKLGRWAAVDARTWRRIKPTIMAFWLLEDGIWKQKRLTREREFVSKRAEVSRENGGRGGRPKSLKNQEPRNLSGSPQDTREEPTYTYTHKEKEDAAPPPTGGSARPAPSSASPPNGGSSSGKAPAAAVEEAVKRAEAESVLVDDLASDEDRFFALKYRLADKNVAFGQAVRLSQLMSEDGYGPVVSALMKSLSARNPSSYVGAIIRDLEKQQGRKKPVRNGSKPALPPAIQEYDDAGYPVRADGPNRWIIANQIHDDTGDVIGW